MLLTLEFRIDGTPRLLIIATFSNLIQLFAALPNLIQLFAALPNLIQDSSCTPRLLNLENFASLPVY